ncbi:MAG: AAA family ATPase, partial [Anaerolineae bacterium]|nr:AAA family ATPase [Anaerolineae bacterium]
MYQEYYNFSREPFRLSPEHGFAYSHKGYTKARAYMDYAYMQAEGFVMITGRPGTGKTTLIDALVNDMSREPVRIANLVCTQLQADDLIKMVAYEFGIPVSVVEKGELLQMLTSRLKTWYRDGRRALLIVDEAQDLSVSAMEELRLLTNLQLDSRPLLQIF